MDLRKLRGIVKPFEFAPFSNKQLKVLTWWGEKSPYKDFDTIILDGSIRSGKTVSAALSFTTWAMENFSGENFAICGKTIHACRRNVVTPLKQMLKGLGYDYLEIRNENLLIVGHEYWVDGVLVTVVNQFHIFGGKDEAAQDLIQGITLAGVLCDEVALMPKSFVEQATGRCSVDGSKYWFSCNPGSPMHWFNVEWIQRQADKRALYLHFTMADNPRMSKKIRERYERLYEGVFYKRYVLGLWVTADGVVYPMFDKERHCIEYERSWTRVFLSGDFGIQNPTTFGLYGYYQPEEHYHLIDRYYHSGRESKEQKTTLDYANELMRFLMRQSVKPDILYLDPSASALIIELMRHPYFKRRKIQILPAKNDVMLGIQFHSYLLSSDKFTLNANNLKKESLAMRTLNKDIEEYGSFIWDDKAVQRGEDAVLKTNDHCMDSNRYGPLSDAINHGAFSGEIDTITGKGALAS